MVNYCKFFAHTINVLLESYKNLLAVVKSLLHLVYEVFSYYKCDILGGFKVSQAVFFEFFNGKIHLSDWQQKQCLFS